MLAIPRMSKSMPRGAVFQDSLTWGGFPGNRLEMENCAQQVFWGVLSGESKKEERQMEQMERPRM